MNSIFKNIFLFPKNLWLGFNQFFDKGCTPIKGLSKLLKVTVISLAIFILSLSIHSEVLLAIIVIWIILLFVAWVLYLPFLLAMILILATKKIGRGISSVPEIVPKIGDITKEELINFLNRVNTFIVFYYYQFKFWAEYNIGNFLDPLPKQKRREGMDTYVRRLPIKQALRYTKYNYYVWSLNALRVEEFDYSQYKGKERVYLKKLASSIIQLSNAWDKIFRETNQRYFDKKLEEERDKRQI